MNAFLPPDQLAVLQNSQFLLTKNQLSTKLVQLLGQTEQALKPLVQAAPLPPGTLQKAGKISRGENYKGLPYWVLDFPRFFEEPNTLAFRTMIWWGHQASITLHLGQQSGQQVLPALLQALPALQKAQLYGCVNKESPWEYEFEPYNYLPLAQQGNTFWQAQWQQAPFIKLALPLPLPQLGQLPAAAVQTWQLLAPLLKGL